MLRLPIFFRIKTSTTHISKSNRRAHNAASTIQRYLFRFQQIRRNLPRLIFCRLRSRYRQFERACAAVHSTLCRILVIFRIVGHSVALSTRCTIQTR